MHETQLTLKTYGLTGFLIRELNDMSTRYFWLFQQLTRLKIMMCIRCNSLCYQRSYCIKLSDKPLMGSTLAHFGLGFPQGDIFVTENRVNSDRIITFELYYMT